MRSAVALIGSCDSQWRHDEIAGEQTSDDCKRNDEHLNEECDRRECVIS